MSIDVVSRIRIGDTTTFTDFTDRVAGYSVRQDIELSRTSSHNAVVTLYNNDGALTPNAGGTYSSVDWFAQAVDIDLSVNGGGTYNNLFAGLVVDFKLFDNGVNSTVDLVVRDWLSFVGRIVDDTTYPQNNLGTSIVNVLANTATSGEMPTLGGTVSAAVTSLSGSTTQTVADIDGYVGRNLNNNLMSSNLCAAWSTGIDVNAALNTVQYQATVVGDHLATGTTTIEFVEGTPTSGKLPVSTIQTGYELRFLTNTASMTRAGGTQQTATDATSIAKYGARTVTATSTQNVDDADTLAAANNIVSRQSTQRFLPRTIRLSKAMVDGLSNASGDKLKVLLNTTGCGFLPCTITYTPTGAASTQTDACVTFGRTITARPGRFDVEIKLLPAQDYASFVLDSDILGVLDTNRLG